MNLRMLLTPHNILAFVLLTIGVVLLFTQPDIGRDPEIIFPVIWLAVMTLYGGFVLANERVVNTYYYPVHDKLMLLYCVVIIALLAKPYIFILSA